MRLLRRLRLFLGYRKPLIKRKLHVAREIEAIPARWAFSKICFNAFVDMIQHIGLALRTNLLGFIFHKPYSELEYPARGVQMSAAITFCNKCGSIFPNQTLYKCPDCKSENLSREAGDYESPTTFDEFDEDDNDPQPAA